MSQAHPSCFLQAQECIQQARPCSASTCQCSSRQLSMHNSPLSSSSNSNLLCTERLLLRSLPLRPPSRCALDSPQPTLRRSVLGTACTVHA